VAFGAVVEDQRTPCATHRSATGGAAMSGGTIFGPDDMTPPPLHWAIKLRKRLLIRGSHKWNGWVRDVTAWIERTA
jgi:hypothetical protein